MEMNSNRFHRRINVFDNRNISAIKYSENTDKTQNAFVYNNDGFSSYHSDSMSSEHRNSCETPYFCHKRKFDANDNSEHQPRFIRKFEPNLKQNFNNGSADYKKPFERGSNFYQNSDFGSGENYLENRSRFMSHSSNLNLNCESDRHNNIGSETAAYQRSNFHFNHEHNDYLNFRERSSHNKNPSSQRFSDFQQNNNGSKIANDYQRSNFHLNHGRNDRFHYTNINSNDEYRPGQRFSDFQQNKNESKIVNYQGSNFHLNHERNDRLHDGEKHSDGEYRPGQRFSDFQQNIGSEIHRRNIQLNHEHNDRSRSRENNCHEENHPRQRFSDFKQNIIGSEIVNYQRSHHHLNHEYNDHFNSREKNSPYENHPGQRFSECYRNNSNVDKYSEMNLDKRIVFSANSETSHHSSNYNYIDGMYNQVNLNKDTDRSGGKQNKEEFWEDLSVGGGFDNYTRTVKTDNHFYNNECLPSNKDTTFNRKKKKVYKKKLKKLALKRKLKNRVQSSAATFFNSKSTNVCKTINLEEGTGPINTSIAFSGKARINKEIQLECKDAPNKNINFQPSEENKVLSNEWIGLVKLGRILYNIFCSTDSLNKDFSHLNVDTMINSDGPVGRGFILLLFEGRSPLCCLERTARMFKSKITFKKSSNNKIKTVTIFWNGIIITQGRDVNVAEAKNIACINAYNYLMKFYFTVKIRNKHYRKKNPLPKNNDANSKTKICVGNSPEKEENKIKSDQPDASEGAGEFSECCDDALTQTTIGILNPDESLKRENTETVIQLEINDSIRKIPDKNIIDDITIVSVGKTVSEKTLIKNPVEDLKNVNIDIEDRSGINDSYPIKVDVVSVTPDKSVISTTDKAQKNIHEVSNDSNVIENNSALIKSENEPVAEKDGVPFTSQKQVEKSNFTAKSEIIDIPLSNQAVNTVFRVFSGCFNLPEGSIDVIVPRGLTEPHHDTFMHFSKLKLHFKKLTNAFGISSKKVTMWSQFIVNNRLENDFKPSYNKYELLTPGSTIVRDEEVDNK